MIALTAKSCVLVRHDGIVQNFDKSIGYQEITQHIGADALCVVNIYTRGLTMYVDDEGHSRNLPVNKVATALYHEICRPGTKFQIVGNVFLKPTET